MTPEILKNLCPYWSVLATWVWISFALNPIAYAQAPFGAKIQIGPTPVGDWALPAEINVRVTHPGSATFAGSNGKVETGVPLFSIEPRGRQATIYRCDLITGFPNRTSGSVPFPNRTGGSSFIAILPTKNTPIFWINASMGAFRIDGSTGTRFEWEYQIRYFSGDPAAKIPPSLSIGTVPNSGLFGALSVTNYQVTLQMAPPGEISLLRLGPELLVSKPTDNPDAPLEVLPSPDLLRNAKGNVGTGNQGGLICDGVTPLLLRFNLPSPRQEATRYLIEAELSGGAIQSGDLLDRLRVYNWTAGTFSPPGTTREIEIPAGKTEGFAILSGVPSDDLIIANGNSQRRVNLTFTASNSSESITSSTISLAKPFVVLLHGYNTDKGTWKPSFTNEIVRLRGPDFVKIVEYGVDVAVDGSPDSGFNTFATLEQLANHVSGLLVDVERSMTNSWAFTRYDAIGHSQGGVLLRMLASVAPPPSVPPFRTTRNHYRGRFHRAVTMGSPHNGSTAIHYLFSITASEDTRDVTFGEGLLRLTKGILKGRNPFKALPSALMPILPSLTARTTIEMGIAQPKFDPWLSQIRSLNAPNGRWQPDPATKFHLIRTLVNGGRKPPETRFDPVPMWFTTRMDRPGVGDVVLPDGSDGVSDFATQAAGMSGDSVSTITSMDIAHVGSPLSLLWMSTTELLGVATGGTSIDGQTTSKATAEVAMEALEGIRTTSRFIAPPLLPKSLGDKIASLGFGPTHFDDIISRLGGTGGGRLPARLQAGEERRSEFALLAPMGYPMGGQVMWAVELVGGTSSDENRIRLETQLGQPNRVTVSYPTDIVGDVVLKASYDSPNGFRVVGLPILVDSLTRGAILNGIILGPVLPSLQIGQRFSPTITGIYSDGIQRRVFAPVFSADITSSDPSVLDAGLGTLIHATGAGSARIAVQYLGHSAFQEYVVIGPPNPNVRASLVDLPSTPGTSTLAISFHRPRNPSSAYEYIIEQSLDLNLWTTLDLTDLQVGEPRPLDEDVEEVTFRSSAPNDAGAVFLRLRISN